ncbi:MAG TPA: hypothetical protein VFW45_00400 [Candidatus Polarisedimenticolia bacterium]|nr:hypothetical protein [Candidatus Polarisedimenticolia bacterium]
MRFKALFSGKPGLDRFLAAVYLLGLTAGAMGILAGGFHLSIQLLLFSIYGAAAAPFLVDLGGNCKLSTAFAFILASAVYLGPGAAVITALATTTSYLGREEMLFHKRLFNVSNHLLSGFIAARLFLAAGGSSATITDEVSLRAMLAAICGFYLVNTGLVGIASALELDRPIVQTWMEKYRWTVASFLAGGTLAVILVLLIDRIGVFTFFLSLPFCLVLFHCWTLQAGFMRSGRPARGESAPSVSHMSKTFPAASSRARK